MRIAAIGFIAACILVPATASAQLPSAPMGRGMAPAAEPAQPAPYAVPAEQGAMAHDGMGEKMMAQGMDMPACSRTVTDHCRQAAVGYACDMRHHGRAHPCPHHPRQHRPTQRKTAR